MTDTDKDLQQHQIPDETSEEDETFANNYAMGIALGLPVGAILGMLIFDNIALGAAIGLALSPVIALLMGQMQKSESQSTGEGEPGPKDHGE